MPADLQKLNDGKSPVQRLNFVDRLVSFVNPSAGITRAIARQKLHEFRYGDRPHERGSSGGMARNANSESFIRQRETIQAMWDARDLVRYDWIGGTISRVVMYVLGECHVKSTYRNTAVARMHDDFFHGWCGDEPDEATEYMRCDITGRHRLLKQLQMNFFGMLVDGDSGFAIRRNPLPGEDFDMATGEVCLQSVQADCIGSPVDGHQSDTYVRGITKDPDFGRIQSYRIYKRSRYGQYTDPVEIEPFNFIHLWDPNFSDQYRGITALLPALEHIRDIKEWIEAEKIAGKTQSQFAGVFGSKNPYNDKGADAWDGKKTAAGTPTQDAKWGQLLKLAEGESFSLIAPPSRPSGAFLAFIQVVIRIVAICLDLPFGLVWDLSTLGGVTARIEVQQAQRRINYWQRLIASVIRRVRKLVLADGIARGLIPADPDWQRFDVHFGPWIVTDAGYETQNDIALLDKGLISAQEIAQKRAKDIEEIMRSSASIAQMAKQIGTETGVPVELFTGGLYEDFTGQMAAMDATPEEINPPPPPAGSQQAVGDKGAAQIADIIEKVGTGEIPHKEAVAMLVTIYSMDPREAEEMVPPTVEKREAPVEQPKPKKEPKKK